LSKKAEEEKSKIVLVLTSLPQLALDFQLACEGSSIYGNKVQRGMRVDPEDAMLAGIVKVYREITVVRNVRHFEGMEGVSVER